MIDALAVRRLTAFSQSLLTIREAPQVVAALGDALREAFEGAPVAVALHDKVRAILVPVSPAGAVPGLTTAPLEAAMAGPIETGTSSGTWLGAPVTVNGNAAGAAAVLLADRPPAAGDRALLDAFLGAAGVALDNLRQEAAHEDARRAWERMVDAVPYALCLVDAAGRARRANRAFATLVNAPTTAIAGRPWLALVPPAWGEGLAEVLATPGSGREVQLRAGNRTFGVSAYPIGPVRGDAVLVFDDQTDRRRLQDQLIQSEKMSAIGQLIAGVAHDLNNPLASVVGFAELSNPTFLSADVVQVAT